MTPSQNEECSRFFPEFTQLFSNMDELYHRERTIDEKTYQFICFALPLPLRLPLRLPFQSVANNSGKMNPLESPPWMSPRVRSGQPGKGGNAKRLWP